MDFTMIQDPRFRWVPWVLLTCLSLPNFTLYLHSEGPPDAEPRPALSEEQGLELPPTMYITDAGH
jgi:hypothetical protein